MDKTKSKLSLYSILTMLTVVLFIIVIPVFCGFYEGNKLEPLQKNRNLTGSKLSASLFSYFAPRVEAATFGRKLIINNEITMKVESVAKVKEEVRKIKAGRGFIGSSEFSIDESGNTVSTIDLKVAADIYSKTRDEIIKLGIVQSEKEDVVDVGDDYYDTQCNINTRQTYHAQILKILTQQKKLETLVQLTEMVTNIQQEINESKSVLNKYDNQLKFANIKIILEQTSKVKLISSNVVQLIKEKQPKYIWTYNSAMDEGVYQLKSNVNYIIYWIILQFTANIIYWLIAVVLILLVIRFIRRFSRELREFFIPQPIIRKPIPIPQEPDVQSPTTPTQTTKKESKISEDQQFSPFEKPSKDNKDEE